MRLLFCLFIYNNYIICIFIMSCHLATSSSRLLNNALKKLSTFDPTQKSFSTSTLCGVDFSALREKRMNSGHLHVNVSSGVMEWRAAAQH